jgi:very-short-patch-repair endonuclease
MTSKLTKYAKSLRKNSTIAETKLWNKLRSRQLEGIKFRRQQPIGDYIVDFVSFEKRVIIELDGGQHSNQKRKDEHRDKRLTEDGYTVLRFWNNDVLENIDAILVTIRRKCLKNLIVQH